MIRIGQVILDQYRVDQVIGTGGMGVVYQVWDLKRNVPLAMKVLNADVNEDPAQLRRFQREANALKKLSHPHIVPFYGFEISGDAAFLLESYVDGADLKQVLGLMPDKRLPLSEALVYLKAVCSALGYAHNFGVVHCDIKPGNVMIDQGGNIYLTDFGIARHTESTSTTFGGAGTPSYMAPEQIRGEAVSPATDLYALGAMFYEMLTGQRPFRGDEKGSESSGATAGERIRYAHQYLQPPDPRSINPAIPPALAQVILRSLAKNPAQRFQSTQEFFLAACNATGLYPDQLGTRVALPAGINAPQPTPSPTHPSQVAATRQPGGHGAPVQQPAYQAPVQAYRAPVYAQPAQTATVPKKGGLTGAGLLVVLFGVIIVVGIIVILVVAGGGIGGGDRPRITVAPPGGLPEPPSGTLPPAPGGVISPAKDSQQDTQFTQDAFSTIAAGTHQAELTLMAPEPTQEPTRTPLPTDTVPPPPTNTPVPPVASTGPVLLAFAKGPIGDSDIYSSEPDGDRVNPEAATSCDEAEPAISPDSRYIAYQSDCDGTYDIWRDDVGIASDNRRLTTDNSHDEREPHWAPDGRQIAYRVTPAGEQRNAVGEIWIMDSNGDNAYFLGILGRSPVFSPDGKTIAYMSDESGKWQIHAFEIASRTAWRVTSEDTHCRWPAWSPDSRYIVYNTAANGSDPDGIWFSPIKGGNATKVISGAGYGRPSWSSNGWIAFNSSEGIDIVRQDGSGHQTIIRLKDAWAPAFSN